MSGYGSGRRRTHHLTGECLPIDTAYLRKCKMLTGKKLQQGKTITFTGSTKDIKGKVTETKHVLHCVVERYSDEGGEFSRWDAAGHMTLLYGVRQGDKEKTCSLDIPLVVTHPNYGGVRWWYLAPCCGRRCRVLYLPTYGSLDLHRPACRECLGLNYASQMQSYIERHKTYEKHLLANYGYAWAEMEYHCLREYYLEITPQIEYLRQRSILDMRVRMLRRLMSFTRVMLRIHMHDLRSLRSEEDKRLYLKHVTKQHGEGYALDLVRMLGLSAQYERDVRLSSSEVINQSYDQLVKDLMQALNEEPHETLHEEVALYTEQEAGKINLHFLLAYKQGLEEDIKHLEQMKPAA